MASNNLDAFATNEIEEHELEGLVGGENVELESAEQLLAQRGTTIPALFTSLYKFIGNPSSVSVETFKRMIDTDDTIGSGVDFLTTCLAARLGPYTHANKGIAAWVNDQLDNIKGGWFNTVKEILSASWAGYSVSEKIWANDPVHGFVPKKVVTLPPSTIMFETDRTGDLTHDGVLQYQRNYGGFQMSGGGNYLGGLLGSGYGFLPDTNARPDPFSRFGDLPYPVRTANNWHYLSIRIPAQKVIHYSYDAQGKFGNPYGRSLLRRCYKYYVLKDSVLQMMAVALDRKGTPLLIVYADSNTTVKDASKVNAAGGGNLKGQRVGTTAAQAASSAFARVHNDTTIVLPGRKGAPYEVDKMDQNSNAQDFIESLNFCNKSIMRALLIPSLVFADGDGTGSYALGQEHSKTFLKILDGTLEGLCNVLIEQLVKEMVAYNFPREQWEKDGYGSFSRRDFSDENLERLSIIWDRAIQNGVIDSTDLQDLNRMRDTLGFSELERPIARESQFVGVEDTFDAPPLVDPAAEQAKQDEGYNGAQVSSILEVLERVSTGVLSHDGAVSLLTVAFQIPREQANAIVLGAQRNVDPKLFEDNNVNDDENQQTDSGSGLDSGTSKGSVPV